MQADPISFMWLFLSLQINLNNEIQQYFFYLTSLKNSLINDQDVIAEGKHINIILIEGLVPAFITKILTMANDKSIFSCFSLVGPTIVSQKI